MNKNILLKTTFCIIICCTLCSCSNKNSKEIKEYKDTINPKVKEFVQQKATYNYFQNVDLKSDEIVIYNLYTMQLGIYNIDKKTWNPIYNEKNVFAYNASGDNKVFSIGNSQYNKFSVIENDSINIKSIYNVDAKDSIILFGKYREEYYFVYNIDDLSNNINRKIVKYDNRKKELVDIFETKNELLSNAVFVQDDIYYTVYKSETDTFILYKYNMATNNITFVKDNMKTDRIYEYNGELLYDDGNKQIVSLTSKLKYPLTTSDRSNEIDSKNGLLFQVYVNDKNDLECSVTNLQKNEKIAQVSNFIGYKVEDNILYLFCNNKIEKVDLSK